MNTFVRKYEKNLIAVAMAFCMICGVLITPQMYKADSMIKDEGFTYTRTWFTNGNNEAWYDYNSSTVPSSHYKRWCFEFVKNGDLFKAGKSFSYNFNIDLSGVTLSSTTGRPSCTLVFTKVDFKDASYVTRYSTNGGELVRSSSGTSMFVYGGTHNIANYDIKYIH